jgi:oligopeptide/dipeptide ABC transporter ATP-binding protein
MALLSVENLVTRYSTEIGDVKAVDDISFKVRQGEIFGLAGESGCGKSTAMLSVINLLPSNGRIVSGSIKFHEYDLATIGMEALRDEIWWNRVSIVFQAAMNALNPVLSVGSQIVEPIMLHDTVTKQEAEERVKELFELVGIDSMRINDYPHEFSGGMRQRAMIAMALACNPELVILDEPTTALDVIVQGEVLELVKDLQERLNLSVLMVTHDLSVIAETCDTTGIMYAGKLVESADTRTIFKEPRHPYTQGLIGAFLRLTGEWKRVEGIPGNPPNLLNPPLGCKFHPRCPYAKERCLQEEPEFIEIGEDHSVACHYVDEVYGKVYGSE